MTFTSFKLQPVLPMYIWSTFAVPAVKLTSIKNLRKSLYFIPLHQVFQLWRSQCGLADQHSVLPSVSSTAAVPTKTVWSDSVHRPFHKTPLLRRRAQHYRHTDNIIGGFGSCFTGISPVSGCGVAHNTLMFICAQVRGSDLAACDLHTQELLPAPLQLQHL